jgi:hypothetical protein
LPSFLTAAASLPLALGWTAEAARSYRKHPQWPRSAGLFPLRAALFIVSVLTFLLIRTTRWKHRIDWALRSPDVESCAGSVREQGTKWSVSAECGVRSSECRADISKEARSWL